MISTLYDAGGDEGTAPRKPRARPYGTFQPPEEPQPAPIPAVGAGASPLGNTTPRPVTDTPDQTMGQAAPVAGTAPALPQGFAPPPMYPTGVPYSPPPLPYQPPAGSETMRGAPSTQPASSGVEALPGGVQSVPAQPMASPAPAPPTAAWGYSPTQGVTLTSQDGTRVGGQAAGGFTTDDAQLKAALKQQFDANGGAAKNGVPISFDEWYEYDYLNKPRPASAPAPDVGRSGNDALLDMARRNAWMQQQYSRGFQNATADMTPDEWQYMGGDDLYGANGELIYQGQQLAGAAPGLYRQPGAYETTGGAIGANDGSKPAPSLAGPVNLGSGQTVPAVPTGLVQAAQQSAANPLALQQNAFSREDQQRQALMQSPVYAALQQLFGAAQGGALGQSGFQYGEGSTGDLAGVGTDQIDPANDLRGQVIRNDPSQRLTGLRGMTDRAAQDVANYDPMADYEGLLSRMRADFEVPDVVAEETGLANRSELARQRLAAFDAEAQPQIADGIKAVGKRAAALGRLGMGDTSIQALRPYTDYLTARSAMATRLAADTAEGEIGDARDRRDYRTGVAERNAGRKVAGRSTAYSMAGNQAASNASNRYGRLSAMRGLEEGVNAEESGLREEQRGERTWQEQLARYAHEQSIRQRELENSEMQQQFGRGLSLANLGYAGNPWQALLAGGNSYGNDAAGAFGGLGDLLAQYMARQGGG